MSSKAAVRWVVRGLIGIVGLTAVMVLAGWLGFRGSLAVLEGHRPLAGLRGVVLIQRDARGVPTIEATNRTDAARALGFVHAQERFFQMDLLRRRAAGELAELFGPNLAAHDLEVRRHQFRATARETLEQLPAAQRNLLEAYAAGVNAGLNLLKVRPPEYLLLRLRPLAWQVEDSLLVAWSMFLTLQDSFGDDDWQRRAAELALPPSALQFFYPTGSDWDTPLDDHRFPPPSPPPPEDLDFRPLNAAHPTDSRPNAAAPVPGSNSWGIPGDLTTTGAAMIANDMHLDLGVPNIWFQALLCWTNDAGQRRQVVGVSLPGVPIIVVGSNGDIAWGFTNAMLDTTDLIPLELDPGRPNQYRSPEGWLAFETTTERILVRGEAPREVRIDRTLWGPVVTLGNPGQPFALRWVAHLPGAVNMGLMAFEEARSAAEAAALAPRCGVPVQNLLVGDRHGQLVWTLIGRLPHRVGFDGRTPVSWADGSRYWEGWRAPADYPRVTARPGQRLWTANHRMLGTSDYLALGPWKANLGARARRIREDLASLPKPIHEPDFLSIYRDDHSLLLQRWHPLLLATTRTLTDLPAGMTRTEVIREVQAWEGRAATNSVAYRLTRAFRYRVIERLWEPVFARCAQAVPGFKPNHEPREEQAAWTLLQGRPAHLLNPRFSSYDALLTDALLVVLTDLRRQGLSLPEATWGQRNTLRMQHPLAIALPQLGRWLDMPAVQLPGDEHMPRVQGTRFGASERLVVSPGFEERGVFEMPGGQSGHFLSPFYRAGFEDWRAVNPSPLLPGVTRHRLWLDPVASPAGAP